MFTNEQKNVKKCEKKKKKADEINRGIVKNIVDSIIETIKKALVSEGRTIADDHYGAGFSYRIGGWDDPAAVAAAESYQKRLGRDAKATFVVGQAEDIIMRISDYVDAGISKFILRPIGASNDDIFQQTSMLIDRVLPNLGKLQQKN